MAGQGQTRREVLQALSLAVLASAAPGFSQWSSAFGEQSHEGMNAAGPAIAPAGKDYAPQFFLPEEYRTIKVLTELILPSNDGPGAKEAGVSEFIDFMVKNDASLQGPFRSGLKWLDDAAGNQQSFAALSQDEQKQILDRLAYKKYQRAQDKAGQEFFALVRRYTVMGFYTSTIGLVALDYPGLKFYATSPGCPHPGNPEHVGI